MQGLILTNRYRFHEVMALRALMRAVPSLRENGDEIMPWHKSMAIDLNLMLKNWDKSYFYHCYQSIYGSEKLSFCYILFWEDLKAMFVVS